MTFGIFLRPGSDTEAAQLDSTGGGAHSNLGPEDLYLRPCRLLNENSGRSSTSPLQAKAVKNAFANSIGSFYPTIASQAVSIQDMSVKHFCLLAASVGGLSGAPAMWVSSVDGDSSKGQENARG
mmetsp:Transcript_27416/g.64237  ORF Transcript_27416/g.64237 Transcript_27416/m.64237 type:complete len:124 (-) Transcript_27416:4-375(-)